MKSMLDIERARERRLWITKVVFPGIAGAIAIWKYFPEVFEAIEQKCTEGVNFIKAKLNKKED